MDNRPECIGIIMDGNRRWARERGLPTFEGHRFGYEKLKELLEWVKEVDVPNLIVYALSTENLKRSEEEVSYLFNLFRTAVRGELEKIAGEGARIIFAGERKKFPKDIQEMISSIEEKTRENHRYHFVIAAPYGGRSEIIHAVNSLLKKGAQSVDEKEFNNYLWTAGIPDPDLIIRTSGEMRLSNFLLWQSVYSELFFTKTYWPDFSRGEFMDILGEYERRERRRGK